MASKLKRRFQCQNEKCQANTEWLTKDEIQSKPPWGDPKEPRCPYCCEKCTAHKAGPDSDEGHLPADTSMKAYEGVKTKLFSQFILILKHILDHGNNRTVPELYDDLGQEGEGKVTVRISELSRMYMVVKTEEERKSTHSKDDCHVYVACPDMIRVMSLDAIPEEFAGEFASINEQTRELARLGKELNDRRDARNGRIRSLLSRCSEWCEDHPDDNLDFWKAVPKAIKWAKRNILNKKRRS